MSSQLSCEVGAFLGWLVQYLEESWRVALEPSGGSVCFVFVFIFSRQSMFTKEGWVGGRDALCYYPYLQDLFFFFFSFSCFLFFCLFVFSVFALASTERQKHRVCSLRAALESSLLLECIFVLSRAQVFVFVLFLLFSSPFFALACLFVLFICWLDGLTKVGVWVVFLPIRKACFLAYYMLLL